MRSIFLMASLAGALEVAVMSPADFTGLYKAATSAHASKDYATEKVKLREALELRPGHPGALYQLAAAQAGSGERDAALDTLGSLAAMGLDFNPGADKDFDALHGVPRFGQLGAEFQHNREPAGDAQAVIRMVNPRFIPEGVAYDQDRSAFFVGGVYERRVVRIDRSGEQVDFNRSPLWSPLGMQADSARRLLWVATAAIPEMRDAKQEELGRSAIVAIDMDNGKEKRRFLLPDDGKPHQLNDLTLAGDGTIYATDARGGMLYSVDSSSGKFAALTKPGDLLSAQGVALSADRKTLYVADYSRGLFAFDLAQKTLTRVEPAERICLYGIDGLARYENQLVAVQNGIRPNRVVRLTLDASGRRVEHATVIAASLRDFDEPTLGVMVGKRFTFVANSQWNHFDQKTHQLPASGELHAPVLMRVTVPD